MMRPKKAELRRRLEEGGEERALFERYQHLRDDLTDVLFDNAETGDSEGLKEMVRSIQGSFPDIFHRVALIKPTRPFDQDSRQDWLSIVSSVGYDPAYNGHNFKAANSLTGLAYHQQKTLRIGNLANENELPFHTLNGDFEDYASSIAVPIIINGTSESMVTGILNIDSREKGVFTDEHKLGLEVIAEHMSGTHQYVETMTKDDMTGLYLRPRFKRDFGVILLKALDEGLPLSVIYLDINDLKGVNDGTFQSREHPIPSHERGDSYVIAVASGIIPSLQRSTDLAGRIGGDEYALALLGMNEKYVPTFLTERLIPNIGASIQRELQFHPGRRFPTPAVAIGFVELQNHIAKGGNPEELLQTADRNMYLHKKFIQGYRKVA